MYNFFSHTINFYVLKNCFRQTTYGMRWQGLRGKVKTECIYMHGNLAKNMVKYEYVG